MGEAVGDPVDAAANLFFDFGAEEVGHGEIDRLFSGVPAGEAGEPDEDEKEREEGEKDVGGDGEGVDVDFDFEEVFQGGEEFTH